MHPAAEKIIAEEAANAGLTPDDLRNSNRNRRYTIARDAALKRLRVETQLSLPQIGRLFGLSTSTVWTALRNDHKHKVADPDEMITRMWKTHTIYEIAAEIGVVSETVRKAGIRLGLGVPYRRRNGSDGHKAFTPRCAEILREHGVRL